LKPTVGNPEIANKFAAPARHRYDFR
jgi:hypothetical protein